MKQTAIDWLTEKLRTEFGFAFSNNILEQAKEMEKKQIIDAREDGFNSTYAEYGETPRCYLDGSSKQYYNETFKNK